MKLATYAAGNETRQAVNQAKTTVATGVTLACIEAVIAVEESGLKAQVAVDSAKPGSQVDAKTQRYVDAKLRERYAKIRAWSEKHVDALRSRQDESQRALAEELRRVTQELETP